MSRGLRWILPGEPVEITTRTMESRMLLPMTPEFRRQVVGTIARAAEAHKVRVHAVVMLSTHWHAILTPEDGKQLADFMCFVNGNIARQVLRYHDRSGKVWGHRYNAVLISPEPEAQEKRLRYLLAHGVKEGLVERVGDWLGLHCAQALRDGKPLEGVWIDRTGLAKARRKQKKVEEKGERPEPIDRKDFETEYKLELEPLPCWKDLPPTERRQKVREMIVEIENAAEARRAINGKPVVGALTVLKQDPDARPAKPKRSPKPLVHAASKAVRTAYRKAYDAFFKAFRWASGLLLGGDRSAEFPRWSFPPALAFARRGEEILPFQ